MEEKWGYFEEWDFRVGGEIVGLFVFSFIFLVLGFRGREEVVSS